LNKWLCIAVVTGVPTCIFTDRSNIQNGS
jgi:hypothetical protein